MATRETARLTADFVLFGTGRDGTTMVLVIERAKAPFAGRWALPGGHVDPGEEAAAAALRELTEETGLRWQIPALATYVGAWSTPGRDPRGRYCTFAYGGHGGDVADLPTPVGQDDARRAEWRPLQEMLRDDAMAFDHGEIVRTAARKLLDYNR